MCIEAKFATLHRDWRGRTHEREVKLLLLLRIEAKFATLHRDWRGRTHEREVKLLLLLMCIKGEICNPSQGLAWSNARTLGKVATFDVH